MQPHFNILKWCLFGISVFFVNCNSTMKDSGFNAPATELIEMEGIISVLAIDEIDPVTKELRGKFINYLQINTGVRFILEPYSDSYTVPLRPNAKVKVFGIMKDKKILYKKIVPLRD